MGCRDDNISLDRIVDWVESAGYQLRRIADYGEWFAGFRAALELLEPRLQAASSLPIIYQWEQPLSQTPDLKCAPPRRLCQRRPEVQGGPGLWVSRCCAERLACGPRRFDASKLRQKAAELTPWEDVPHLDEAFVPSEPEAPGRTWCGQSSLTRQISAHQPAAFACPLEQQH